MPSTQERLGHSVHEHSHPSVGLRGLHLTERSRRRARGSQLIEVVYEMDMTEHVGHAPGIGHHAVEREPHLFNIQVRVRDMYALQVPPKMKSILVKMPQPVSED
jgi:hypothetical protein